jgi:Family of unknown function (DUF6152)
MNSTLRLCTIASLLAGSTIALSAHHTISAFYDVTRQATLKGVVADVEWKNPHSFVHLDVADVNGHVVRWDVETQAPYVLRQRHTSLEDAITPGDTVSVTVCVAKDGASKGWLRELVTPAGMTIDLSGAGGC